MALLDEDIKGRLTRCNNEEHINSNSNDKNKLCVWCDDCQKNLCELDFENDTEHNYILYTDIMPDDKFKIIMKEKLDKLKSLIDRYENFFPNGKGILKYLIKAYNRNFMNYNLYYNEKIINYQICVNMLFNNKDDFNNNLFELYEESLAKIENISLYKNILNTKGTNRVSAKHIIKKFEKSK